MDFVNTIETIGKQAFRNTKLKGDLVLPTYLKDLGEWTFLNTKFTSLKIIIII
ncbi:hypothetical protein [Mycoplasmopsis fermentans]|uniref:hypothetical protein n=1 Tax=Mycoplasmopsis fermentans TaxID=2115 RepID=UPI00031675EE|nr:hypothetical protein [Mycoplasmopsis fermentans]